LTIPALPLFHVVAGRPVIVLGSGEAAAAKRRLVTRAGGVVFADADAGVAAGARLAFVAHDDADACEADAERLHAAGLLVNVTDRPELCDFTVPSLLDRAPVLVAVGTGGASAGLAKALRLRLDALLPAGLGALAGALQEARGKLRERWPDPAARRRALDAALAQGGALDPLVEADAQAVAGWLAAANDPERNNIAEIRLRSPDPDDLTLREARLLGQADTLAHEPDVAPAILARARADAVRIVVARDAPAPQLPGLTIVLRS
jgi:uroporphyrin-III C-methyltransferase / precorrin-2 dehydrogenase / sirohydrochlorin ferrochelatase